MLAASFNEESDEIGHTFVQPHCILLVANPIFNLFYSLNMKPKSSVNRPPTPDVAENLPEREPTFQELLNIKFIETGEKERLMELLRERLVDCGWKDEMKSICRAFVKKKGRNNVTVDELVHVITPKGRAAVPDSVKAELLQRIRTFLVSAAL
ncbi:hypothetical protein P8452_64105 [Trifolium repens]|nr:hypothetical protein P8452_64105 [Trifolium repens]